MEKYIIILIIIAMLVFSFFTFSVFGKEPSKVYAVLNSDNIADKVLKNSEKWQANSYFVYKISEEDREYINKIPEALTVKEYIFKKSNNIYVNNPYLKTASSGGVSVVGMPYIID